MIEYYLEEIIIKNFEDSIIFASLNGTCAFNSDSNSSDIDILVVLDNKKVVNDYETFLEKRKKFTRDYFKIHDKLHKKPDCLFPGEIICNLMAHDAVSGRGTDIIDNKLELRTVSSDDYWSNPENEYRCWRSMIAFNNNCHINGNKDVLSEYQMLAQAEIFKQHVFELDLDFFPSPTNLAKQIMMKGKGYLGFDQNYEPAFTDFITKKYDAILASLKFVDSNRKINKDELLIDRNTLLYKIKNNHFKSQKLFNWEDIK